MYISCTYIPAIPVPVPGQVLYAYTYSIKVPGTCNRQSQSLLQYRTQYLVPGTGMVPGTRYIKTLSHTVLVPGTDGDLDQLSSILNPIIPLQAPLYLVSPSIDYRYLTRIITNEQYSRWVG